MVPRVVLMKSGLDKNVNTVRPKAVVNAARPKVVVNDVKGNNVNAVKASACWVWKPKTKVLDHGNPQMDLQDKGVIDSGCSRHMTWNMSYLTDYEEIDEGYVSFGGNPKGGKITGKGTIKTGNLDFENVYFVRELKFNLFSVSQMCDKKNSVLFNDTECIVLSPNFKLIDESQVLLRVPRKNNMYSVDLKNIVPKGGLTCLFAKATSDESKLWHRRLGHLNFKTMNKLVKGNLVRGLPSKLFENDQTCVACQKGKQHRASCKSKTENSISLPLHLLHMDLFGPTFVKSLMKKMYCLVVTDDYSRFTWVFFLATKDETSDILKSFITGIENLVDHKVKVIRCDNGIEFKNREMNQFCKMNSILRQFSVARNFQQNGVAERRNRTLIEAARTMLANSKLPTTFWAEAVNTACYVQNKVLVVKPHNKTPYELFHGRTPTLSFIRPFGCPVTILNTIDHLGKFDGKADEGFFVGYSLNSKAFRVFNSRTRIVEENLHIRFSESTPNAVDSGPDWLFGFYALTRTMNYEPIVASTQSNSFVEKEDNVNNTNNVYVAGTNEVNAVGGKTSIELPFDPNMHALEDYSIFDFSRDDKDDGSVADMNNLDTTIQVSLIPTTRIHKDHPLDQVIRDLQSTTQTRKMSKNLEEHGRTQKGNSCIEGSKLDRGYAGRASTIQVTRSLDFSGFTKWKKGYRLWVFRNKKDERGIVIRNKARLVAQGYTQEEGTDYDEVFAPVARIEAIRLFLAYASFKDFMVYQMDVKSAFIYGKIEEEVYVCQPPRFEDPDFPDRVTPLFQTMVVQDQSQLGKDEVIYKKLGDSLVRASITASSLEAEQDSGNINKTQSKATPNESSSLGSTSGGGPRVLDLEKTKTTQHNEIASLKRRVKKLEKKNRSRTHKLKRLYKVGLTARVESSDNEESLGEDASKQGRINAIDADEEITLVKQEVSIKDVNNEVNVVKEVAEVINYAKLITDAAQVSVAGNVVSTAGDATTVSAATTTTATITTVDGKGILIEPVKPIKKKDLIRLDEKAALKLQAEFDEERLAREKAEKEKEANIALIETWDDIQTKIDADHQLAERLQVQEQEELSIKEKATLFQQLLEKRKKHFAAKRAEEKRSKPSTKAQQRKIMCTYLKNMEGYKLKDLKFKEFDSIQEMFDRAFKRVNTFEDFRTELVEGKEKRAGTELIQENAKKQKVEDDKETAELKQCLEIIPDEEEVTVDAIPLAVKSPSIVDWKIYKEGRKSYYQIIRADGKSQTYMIFSQMLKSFDRHDLEDLYKLLKAKYESTRLVEDLDLLL
ncbi:putative ribonuclease H-like domain-containing protein [Tanacetum coccineum]